jgi:hypothetical protein
MSLEDTFPRSMMQWNLHDETRVRTLESDIIIQA